MSTGEYTTQASSVRSRDSRFFSEFLRIGKQTVDAYNPKSISTNTEYGGFLYQHKGKVKATAPVIAICASETECSVDIGPSLRWVPERAKVLGDYHTHGSGSGDVNLFSRDDITLTNSTSGFLSDHGFQTRYFGSILGTPSNRVYFYRAGTLPDNPKWDDIQGAMQEIE